MTKENQPIIPEGYKQMMKEVEQLQKKYKHAISNPSKPGMKRNAPSNRDDSEDPPSKYRKIEKECPICMNTILKPAILKCAHKFCFECI